jgi:hypothetical protein
VADFAVVALDTRRWFDRSQPQTLQIATWFLYLNAVFALIDLIDESGWLGAARILRGSIGTIVGIAVVAAYVAGGWLMANERKLGHTLGLVAAFSPFLLRFWLLSDSGASTFDTLTGGRTISFIFEVALCALLLHPQSRSHVRVWFK